MKKTTSFGKVFFLLSMLSVLLICADAAAQFSMSAGGSRSKKDRKGGTTTITSDTMDIDIQNDMATFIGNVEVDDPEMNIKCGKMVIYLENKPEDKTEKPDEKAVAKDDGKKSVEETGSNKQVSRIECIGDVVIIRKVEAVPGEPVPEAQKAIAGKAEYNLRNDTITLTEKPVIMRGTDILKGERITINTKTEKMAVIGGTGTFSNPTKNTGDEEDKKPAEGSAK